MCYWSSYFLCLLSLSGWLVSTHATSNIASTLFGRTIKRGCPLIPSLALHTVDRINLFEAFNSTKAQSFRVERNQGYSEVTTSVVIIIPLFENYAARTAREACSMFSLRHTNHIVRLNGISVEIHRGQPFVLASVDHYDSNLGDESVYLHTSHLHSMFGNSILGGYTPYEDEPASLLLASPTVKPRWILWLRNVFRQVALGVQDMHRHNFVHMGLSAEAVLIRYAKNIDDSKRLYALRVPEVALTTFGLASKVASGALKQGFDHVQRWLTSRSPKIRTVEYAAPELLTPWEIRIQETWGSIDDLLRTYFAANHEQQQEIESFLAAQGPVSHPTVSSNIYSLGITFYVVATNMFPFSIPKSYTDSNGKRHTAQSSSMIAKVLMLDRVLNLNCRHLDEKLCDLIHWMILPVSKRPKNMQEVLGHPFFREADIYAANH